MSIVHHLRLGPAVHPSIRKRRTRIAVVWGHGGVSTRRISGLPAAGRTHFARSTRTARSSTSTSAPRAIPAAATAFLTRAVESTAVTPSVATTDRARSIRPRLRQSCLRSAHHGQAPSTADRARPSASERADALDAWLPDPSMRSVVCAGHGFMRNLRGGFYDLGCPGRETRRHRLDVSSAPGTN
jgi:hypothetical protein